MRWPDGAAVVLAGLGYGCAPPEEPAAVADAAPEVARAIVDDASWVTVAERRLAHARLILARDPTGRGRLSLALGDAAPQPIRCDDQLQGAWGLWVDDIDGDGNAEAIVALHKAARFDATVANRLHVYGFEGNQCVPAWRGTRLAGRFDGVATDPDDRGALVVHEWLSPTRRRVARYRWQGFGYRLEAVHWEGRHAPPAAVVAGLDFGPSPVARSTLPSP